MSFKRISIGNTTSLMADTIVIDRAQSELIYGSVIGYATACLLYTSPSPRDA